MEHKVGDLVLWDTPITGETHCGSIIEFRHGYLPGSRIRFAMILPLDAEECVTVEVARLRTLAEEVSAPPAEPAGPAEIVVGDLVEWTETMCGSVRAGTVAAFRSGSLPGSTLKIALIEPIDSEFIASVGVGRLRRVGEVAA